MFENQHVEEYYLIFNVAITRPECIFGYISHKIKNGENENNYILLSIKTID